MFVLKKTTSNLSSSNHCHSTSKECNVSHHFYRFDSSELVTKSSKRCNNHFERVEKIFFTSSIVTCFLTLRSIHKIPFKYLLRTFYVRYVSLGIRSKYSRGFRFFFLRSLLIRSKTSRFLFRLFFLDIVRFDCNETTFAIIVYARILISNG